MCTCDPVGKGRSLEDSDTLDLKDEISELRQKLQVAVREKEEERREARRMKEQLVKREKEVGELLAAGHLSTRDVVRMVGRGDKMAVRRNACVE